MSFDAVAEQEAILTRARTLIGCRVFDQIQDWAVMAKSDDGLTKPYIVVIFGELYDVGSNDRTIMGEEQQPAIMPVTFEVWGSTESDIRHTAGAVRTLFRGWAANQNMSPLSFRGGGSFLQRDSGGQPSRFLRTVTFETILNYQVDTSIVVQ